MCMRLKMKHYKVMAIFVGVFFIFGIGSPVYAQSNEESIDSTNVCGMQAVESNTGVLSPLPRDSYTVYVQLAKREQRAAVKLYASEPDGSRCIAVGGATVSGNGWTSMGSWRMDAEPKAGAQFFLASDELDVAIDANRPTVMLVSNTQPTCKPDPSCHVNVEGHLGTILPPSNSIASNILRVTRVVPPESDVIERVTYYVNEQPVYTTKTLKPFDLRYVTHSKQRTVRVVEYASGQRISITDPIPTSHHDTFFNFLFRTYKKNSVIVLVLTIGISIWILALLFLSIYKAVSYRRYWRVSHGLAKEKRKFKEMPVLSKVEYYRRNWIKSRIATPFTILSVVLFVLITSVLFNRYIATLYTVNGISMTNMYQDGSRVVVNRLPVTLANISSRDYIPKRGEVVVLNAVYGYLQPQEDEDNSKQEFIIKRVIGLPGERVTIINGTVTVYTLDGTIVHPDTDSLWHTTMVKSENIENIDITLGEDELFVIGDNRLDSLDSRFNGAIRAGELVGVASLKL